MGDSPGSRAPTCKSLHHLIDPAKWLHLQFGLFFCSNHWSTTGPSKAVVRMCCPVGGNVLIKDPLPLIAKSSLCGDGAFSRKKHVTITICLTPNSQSYENQCALEASLNKANLV